MSTFVLGDIHGAFKALKQCFKRSEFSLENDCLIFLGDVCDRGPDTVECIDFLLEVNNLIPLMGNHDWWTMKWLKGEEFDMEKWMKHGGQETYDSYTQSHDFDSLKQTHLKKYYDKLLPYFKDDHNRVFVHAGFDWTGPIEETGFSNDYYWDRELFRAAVHYHPENLKFPKSSPYEEIYIGHSPTHRLNSQFDGSKPIRLCNVWCMDQGAGWGLQLSMMDIDSKVVFQSDRVDELYK